MQKIRVSAISFYNTLPFVFGLKNTDIKNEIDLMLNFPAECATLLASGSAEIGLVPVATIPEINNVNLFSEYCIGSNGNARTVILASEKPWKEINEIVLDYQSRTSVALIKLIAKEFWKIDVNFRIGAPGFELNEIKNRTAAVVIGDKVFSIEKKYNYVYDLAKVWKDFTGLPFVFACWVSNCNLDKGFINNFEEAMHYGISHIPEALASVKINGTIQQNEIEDYLTNNMSFELDERKKEAMKLFLKMNKDNLAI